MRGITVKIEMQGYKTEFGITTFPDRKRPCLFLSRGAMIEPLAYFTTDEKAETFRVVLDQLISGFETYNPAPPLTTKKRGRRA